MSERNPHPEALENVEAVLLPESKIHYALRDPDKRQPFAALGFSEGAGNWRELRDAITEELPTRPAIFSHRDEWGTTFDVDISVTGPEGKEAPVRTKWIYRTEEEFPRLVTLYVKTTEWRRRERREDA